MHDIDALTSPTASRCRLPGGDALLYQTTRYRLTLLSCCREALEKTTYLPVMLHSHLCEVISGQLRGKDKCEISADHQCYVGEDKLLSL